MRYLRYYILLITPLFVMNTIAQKRGTEGTGIIVSDPLPVILNEYSGINDSLYYLEGVCKNNWMTLIHRMQTQPGHTGQYDNSLLRVHGNILYNFSYRSYIDTPFAQRDLVQHLVQTNFNFLLKNKYPVKMILTNRSSNSPYFKNYFDVNLQFSQQQLLNTVKANMLAKADSMLNVNYKELNAPSIKLANLQSQYQQLQLWLTSPLTIQQLADEKEKRLSDSLKQLTALKRNIINKDQIKKELESEKDSALAGLNVTDKRLLDSLENYSKEKVNKALPGNQLSFLKKKGKGLSDFADSSMLAGIAAKDSSLREKYNKGKEKLEVIKKEIKQTVTQIQTAQKKIRDSINGIKNEINRISNPDSLYAFMNKNKLPVEKLSKAQRLLLSVKQIGIGRSWVDYSELTVKNISLTGFNMELNPGRYYFAFAAGSVNYRFRDFIYKNDVKQPNQSLYLVRAGIGKKESNNIIATVYCGKKQVMNSIADSGGQSLQGLIGISLESKFFINRNNYLVAEFAKSSYLKSPVEPQNNSALINKVFDLGTHANEAYSIKLFSENPSTNTKLSAFYKKTGQYFQSYNLYPVNINQDAWAVKVSQKLWRKQLTLDAAIKQNDFVNPAAAISFSNKTIFKSLQASLKIPKYPFVSVGYYPTSQLMLVNGNLLQESQYNTLNTIINYTYQVNKTAMNSNIVLTKFYNNSSDTGFIYFNALSFAATQQIYLSQFSFTSGMGITSQKDLYLFTLEQQVNYQVSKNISLTGGVKWNRLNHNETLFGGTAALGWVISKLGTLQFQYDKTYLPGNVRQLMPVDMGRMSFYREF